MENVNDLSNKPYVKGVGEKILTNPSISNTEVINLSLKRILGTTFASRTFNNLFGSSMSNLLFETVSDSDFKSEFISTIINEIKEYEYRIDISPSDIQIEPNLSNHLLVMTINYRIKQSLIKGSFKTGVQV